MRREYNYRTITFHRPSSTIEIVPAMLLILAMDEPENIIWVLEAKTHNASTVTKIAARTNQAKRILSVIISILVMLVYEV